MKIYCIKCKRKTDSIDSKKESIANKLIIDKSRCKTCKANKSTFVRQKPPKKMSVGTISSS